MNVEILKKAGVDYERGVKRFVGRANLYEKALRKFLRDDSFDRLRASYEAGDAAQLLTDAHEFKGMCGNIALPTLYSGADELVSILRRESCGQKELEDAFLRLKNNYNTVYDAIKAAEEMDE